MLSVSNKSSIVLLVVILMIVFRGRCDDDLFDVFEGEGVLGVGVLGVGGGGNVRWFFLILWEK